MKIGDKIPVVLTVVRSANQTEIIKDIDGKDVEINNIRGNKFWASPNGTPNGPFILLCSDGETEAGEIRRKAMVDLIECGVGS